MMQKYLVALASVLLVPVVLGFLANENYPTFALCDPYIMSPIQDYWTAFGRPTNNLQKIEDSGELIVLHTSYDHYNRENKCFYIKVTGSIMNVIFVTKNGEASANHTWVVEEGYDGVIRGHRLANETPPITWIWYTISFDDGVHVCYICSDTAGSPEPYLGNVMLAEDSTMNFPFMETTINTFLYLLKDWGINFRFNYGPECFPNE